MNLLAFPLFLCCLSACLSSALNLSSPFFLHIDALLMGPLAVSVSSDATSRFVSTPADCEESIFPNMASKGQSMWLGKVGLASVEGGPAHCK